MSRREGRKRRARRQQIRAGTAGRLAPSAQPGSGQGDWKPAPPVSGRGASSFPPPTQLQGWRFGGGRAGSRTSKAGGCAQEAAAGAALEPQSGGREGAAGTCIVRAPLPAGPPGAPRRAFLASAAGAGPPAVRQVVTGPRGLELHVHSFIHASINY